MLARVLAVVMCLSVYVCVSHAGIVSKRLNVGSRKQRYSIAHRIWFSDAKIRWWTTPLTPEICAQSDAPPVQTAQFRQISAHSASTVRAGEKRSISTNRKSTTRFPTSHRWTVYVTPKSPKGWNKTRFCCFFPVKFKFCRKNVCEKFLCVKTSSSIVVATSFLYLAVHRWIAGDVPIYQIFALKWPTPSENAGFDWFRLIVPQPSELARKV